MNSTPAKLDLRAPTRTCLIWLLLCGGAGVGAAEGAGAPQEGAPQAAALGEPEIAPEPAAPDSASAATATLEEVLGEEVSPLDLVEQQIEAQEYPESALWLERHIAEIEAESHRFDPRLVRPLTLLGDAYAGQGRQQEALVRYQRALHLSRVNDGLNTPDQVAIVYREATVLKSLGSYQAANDREEYAYDVLHRAHGPLDEELLPGIYHLAQWYERTSNVFAARSLYEQAVRIIEAHDKLETPAAIPALRGIATSYRMERFPPFYLSDMEQDESSVIAGSAFRQQVTVNNFPAGEAALQRIIRIRQEQQPVDQLALAGSVLDLADWYTLFDKSRRAEPLYAHAWELMADMENFDTASYFADPELLYFPTPGNPSAPPPEQRGERSTGYVEVAFSVTEDGYVRNLDTVASQPDGLMDFRVRKSLRLARYRPMLVDGVPVARESFTYRHEFPYYAARPAEEISAAVDPGR
ncbi:MAG: energy transducer TonB [Pseudomonadales bacterium]